MQFNLLLLVLSAPDLETIPFFATAFMHDSRYFFLFPSFPLSSVSQTAPFPTLAPCRSCSPKHKCCFAALLQHLSSWSTPWLPCDACNGLQFPSWACTTQKSTKSWLYASHRPYCCLCMPAWFAPFSAVWHFWLLFSLMVTLDPLLYSYSTSCRHSVFILLTIPAHLFCAEFSACPLVWF